MGDVVINNEKCREIIGFERYHISESGRIYRTEIGKQRSWRTKGRVYINENKIHFRTRNGELRDGYASLTDSNGKLRSVNVAPLVAIAFGVVSDKFDKKKNAIGFKDGDKRNLHYLNLQVINRVKTNGKLTLEDVKHIKKQIRKRVPLNKIAYLFCVSETQINRIKTGENWGNGKRKIKKPNVPFAIEDGRVRRYIATFDSVKTAKSIRKTFTVKRNSENPTDNTIVGIVKGYKLSLQHKNITRAREMAEKLNTYFFENKIEKETVINTYK